MDRTYGRILTLLDTSGAPPGTVRLFRLCGFCVDFPHKTRTALSALVSDPCAASCAGCADSASKSRTQNPHKPHRPSTCTDTLQTPAPCGFCAPVRLPGDRKPNNRHCHSKHETRGPLDLDGHVTDIYAGQSGIVNCSLGSKSGSIMMYLWTPNGYTCPYWTPFVDPYATPD